MSSSSVLPKPVSADFRAHFKSSVRVGCIVGVSAIGLAALAIGLCGSGVIACSVSVATIAVAAAGIIWIGTAIATLAAFAILSVRNRPAKNVNSGSAGSPEMPTLPSANFTDTRQQTQTPFKTKGRVIGLIVQSFQNHYYCLRFGTENTIREILKKYIRDRDSEKHLSFVVRIMKHGKNPLQKGYLNVSHLETKVSDLDSNTLGFNFTDRGTYLMRVHIVGFESPSHIPTISVADILEK